MRDVRINPQVFLPQAGLDPPSWPFEGVRPVLADCGRWPHVLGRVLLQTWLRGRTSDHGVGGSPHAAGGGDLQEAPAASESGEPARIREGDGVIEYRIGDGLMAKRTKVDPRHIADAAVLASRANHYLIRLVSIREEDASHAKQLLIDLENNGEVSEEEMDRALFLLSEAAGLPERQL